MGVDLDPSLPEVLIMVIGGVIRDPTKSAPNWPDPENNIFYCDLIGLNHWRGFTNGYKAEIQLVIATWEFWAMSQFPLTVRTYFLANSPDGPLNALENTVEFNDGYDHGFCSVSDPLADIADPTSSLTTIANAMSIPLRPTLRVDPFVVNEDETVYRYADKKDGTNVKILLDRDYVP